MTSKLLIEHLTIVLCAICIAIVAGLFLGVIAYLFPKARKVILNLADLLQTIPSLAMLGLIMIVIGAGKQTVIIGLALYSLLPIIRNTVLGLTEVSPAIKEAAMGCGMTKFQSLFQVELPMAFPVVFTGIRIATVNSISTAVFATFVGGGGIGPVIYRGIRIQNMGMILSGTAALMIMAIFFDTLMGWIERRMMAKNGLTPYPLTTPLNSPRKEGLPECPSVSSLFSLPLPCLPASSPAAAALSMKSNCMTATIPKSSWFTKWWNCWWRSRTDIEVTIKDQMSSVLMFRELTREDPSCDIMCSYDRIGTDHPSQTGPAGCPRGSNAVRLCERTGL